MSKKLLLPPNEIAAVLKCIDNVVDRRIEISKKDASERKPDVNHKRNAEFLEGARASLKSKMTKVLAPSVPTESSPSSPSSASLLDTEAIDRLSSLNAAFDAQAAKVAALREEAALKSLEVTSMELASREAAVVDAASAAAPPSSSATVTSSSRTSELLVGMDASLRKMGATLGSLVADMPDALDGLSKTLDAVEALAQGKDLSKDYLANHPVDVAIRTSFKADSSSSSSSSSSFSAASVATATAAPLSAVKTPSSAAKRRKSTTPSKAEGEQQEGEWDEDAFANLVGR